MKADTSKIRFAEAQKLLDYGYSSFSYKKLNEKDEIATNVTINKGITNNINLLFEDNCGITLEKNSSQEIEQNISIDENIYAPINKGQKLGYVTYSLNGEELQTVSLIAETGIEKLNLINMYNNIIKNWFCLFRI